MKRRRLIAIAAVIVGLSIAAIAFWPGEKEPVYQGKKLSEWMLINVRAREDLGDKAAFESKQAIRNIGTNALPFLVKSVQRKDAGFKVKVKRWINSCWNRLPDWITTSYDAGQDDDFVLWYAQARAFGVLREMANPAMPALVQIAMTNSDTAIAGRAVVCLSSIGSNAAPALMSIATNKGLPMDVRSEAATGLGMIGRSVPATAQDLISLLNSDEPPIAEAAATALSVMGGAVADAVVPALMAKLQDRNVEVRAAAARGIGLFDGQAVAAEEILTSMLDDSNPEVRQAAKASLVRIRMAKGGRPMKVRE